MKQYRIRCIATGEWVSVNSGKYDFSTVGAAKGAYATSGVHYSRYDIPDPWRATNVREARKWDAQDKLEIVEFTLCEAGVLGEAQQTVKTAVSFLEEILENHTPWNLEFSRKIEAFIKDNK